MQEQLIFNVVFASQVVLLSWILPRRLVALMGYVFQTYPPSTHPRLYPLPLEHYEAKRRAFNSMNLAIFCIGLLLLAGLVAIPHDMDQANMVSFWFYLVQLLPLLWLDLRLRKELRLMRELDTRSIRTAELSPRRLFDVIAPPLFWSTVGVYIAFWIFTTYMRQFDYPWFGGYLNNAIITAANLFFVGIVAYFMYGKKLNPHQSHADRMRTVQMMAKIFAFVSIAVTTHAMISILLSAADARDLHPVVQSIYFQIIAFASYQVYRIDRMDFDVYRKDTVPI